MRIYNKLVHSLKRMWLVLSIENTNPFLKVNRLNVIKIIACKNFLIYGWTSTKTHLYGRLERNEKKYFYINGHWSSIFSTSGILCYVLYIMNYQSVKLKIMSYTNLGMFYYELPEDKRKKWCFHIKVVAKTKNERYYLATQIFHWLDTCKFIPKGDVYRRYGVLEYEVVHRHLIMF